MACVGVLLVTDALLRERVPLLTDLAALFWLQASFAARALLTAGQLPTYFAGYRAVGAVAADLRVLHPDWSDREVHDLMLGHGSPAPRHLRTLLGI